MGLGSYNVLQNSRSPARGEMEGKIEYVVYCDARQFVVLLPLLWGQPGCQHAMALMAR